MTDVTAISFIVATNDSSGYRLMLTAPDLVDANSSVESPQPSLSYATLNNGAAVSATNQLSNAAGVFVSTSIHSERWHRVFQSGLDCEHLRGTGCSGTYATQLQLRGAGV